MRLIIIFFIISLVPELIFSQVIISGKMENAIANEEVRIIYYSNSFNYDEVTLAKTRFDAKGRFIMSFNLEKPVSARFLCGNLSTNLFLLPNDSLFINCDLDNFEKSLKYSGRGAVDNNYLAADYLMSFTKNANNYSWFTDADRCQLYEDSLENENQKFLKTHENDGFSPEFLSYIKIETKYRYINPRYMFSIVIDPMRNTITRRQLPESYFNFLKNLDLNDQDAAENSNYTVALRRYLSEFHDSKTDTISTLGFTRIQKAAFYGRRNYDYRKSVFKDKVLDSQLSYFLHSFIEDYGSNTLFLEELVSDYKTICKNPAYIAIIDSTLSKAKNLSPGSYAPDFRLIDSKGTFTSLSSLKGKVIYMDFWSRGCVPCLISMPHVRDLARKFKDRNDFVVLFVNVNDVKTLWEKFKEGQTQIGIEVFADKKQSEDLYKMYNFNGIPHYVLIDKEGKIVNSNMNGLPYDEAAILDALK